MYVLDISESWIIITLSRLGIEIGCDMDNNILLDYGYRGSSCHYHSGVSTGVFAEVDLPRYNR